MRPEGVREFLGPRLEEGAVSEVAARRAKPRPRSGARLVHADVHAGARDARPQISNENLATLMALGFDEGSASSRSTTPRATWKTPPPCCTMNRTASCGRGRRSARPRAARAAGAGGGAPEARAAAREAERQERERSGRREAERREREQREQRAREAERQARAARAAGAGGGAPEARAAGAGGGAPEDHRAGRAACPARRGGARVHVRRGRLLSSPRARSDRGHDGRRIMRSPRHCDWA